MRVLAAIIAHPLRKVSGATNAARDLTVATSRLTDIELAIMWDHDHTVSADGLTTHHLACWNRLGPAARVAPRFASVPLYDSRLPELATSGRYDLVHIHNLVPTAAAARLATACRRKGIPYVITSHGFYELSRYAEINGFGAIKSALVSLGITRPVNKIIRESAAIFALSDFDRDLVAPLGVGPERVHLVTNGVNEFFIDPPTAEETREVRRKFGLTDEPKLLFMGSLHAYKGVGVYLRSLKEINGGKGFQPILAGRFKNNDERDALLREAELPEELARRVVCTGGVSNAELRALYHEADIFVYPTMGDTLPLVVLEAMASRLPVVSTTVAGIPFAVSKECGILVPPNNVSAVSRAVTTLLADSELRFRMGQRGRARVEEVFRWPAAAKCAVEAYRSVLGARPMAEVRDEVRTA